MTYNAAHPTRRDEIRFLVVDTTEPHLVPDVTIDAELARETDWRLAAATIAEGVAVQLERKLTGLSSAGDSLQWGDRAKSLRSMAQRWRVEVAAERVATSMNAGISGVRLSRRDIADAGIEYTRPRKRGF